MLKKYTNKTASLRSITFVDGSSQFLMRGQSVTTDKPVARVQEGVVVADVPVARTGSPLRRNAPQRGPRQMIDLRERAERARAEAKAKAEQKEKDEAKETTDKPEEKKETPTRKKTSKADKQADEKKEDASEKGE